MHPVKATGCALGRASMSVAGGGAEQGQKVGRGVRV